MVCALPGLAAGPAPVKPLSLSQLEQQLAEIDSELSHLAHYSLRSGVGPIGYRSVQHPDANHREWVQIALGKNTPIDEIVLVPAIWRDMTTGFRADGFPVEFRVLAGHESDTNGAALATFGLHDRILPRIAPLIIPCPNTTASWIRVEATILSPRIFDGQYALELAEVMVFNGPENIALRRPVLTPSGEDNESAARGPRCLVDGFTPFLMQSGEGKPGVAYVSAYGVGKNPSLTIDLGSSYPLTRLNLHAVDVDDSFPQVEPFDFCIPRHFILEGADRPDFTNAVALAEFRAASPYESGPIIILDFPETRCRYVRLTALDPYRAKYKGEDRTLIGFSEIELFSKGRNVALGKPMIANFKPTGRLLNHLTDGANFYGTILPLREWTEQLARRHDRENERIVIAAELNLRYARQTVLLHRMSWLAALLIAGLAFTILIDRLLRLRGVARIKERLAADLHDEIGANLHTIDMLSDLAEDAKADTDELSMLHLRIRAMTRRSSTAVRHFAGLLNANGLYADLASDIRRASERIMDKFEQDVTVEGGEHLHKLGASTGFDLFLFYKECLVNIIRHSGATRFSTRLAATDRELQLTVTDNGRGVAGSGGNRIPPSLKRRAKLMGAKLAVESPEGGGTRIVLTLRTRRWGRL
jgi:signal transduction histidine kinase